METARMDAYQELHEAIYHCNLCKDKGYFVERVQPKWDPSRVHRDTPHYWGMLVGQAPGKRERDKRGAFRGKAGRGVRAWIEEAGIPEAEVFPHLLKTSVTKCYPGKHIRRDGREIPYDRKPTRAEIGLCAPFLKRQIELVQPKLIIPMGMVAINWFFPDARRLDEIVGHRLEWQQQGRGYTVICIPHPSPGSRWLNFESNRELLCTALGLIREQWRTTTHSG